MIPLEKQRPRRRFIVVELPTGRPLHLDVILNLLAIEFDADELRVLRLFSILEARRLEDNVKRLPLAGRLGRVAGRLGGAVDRPYIALPQLVIRLAEAVQDL